MCLKGGSSRDSSCPSQEAPTWSLCALSRPAKRASRRLGEPRTGAGIRRRCGAHKRLGGQAGLGEPFSTIRPVLDECLAERSPLRGLG